jgi:hypothetical protein
VKRFLAPLVGLALVGSVATAMSPMAASAGAPSSPRATQVVRGHQFSIHKVASVNMAQAARTQRHRSMNRSAKRMLRQYLKFRARIARSSGHVDTHGLTTPTPASYFSLSSSSGSATPHNGLNVWDQADVIGGDVEPPDQGLCSNGSLNLELINLAGQLYDNSGNDKWVDPVALNTFFGIPASSFASDPKCYYDPSWGHWIASMLSETISGEFDINLAISDTNDPNGFWHTFEFNVTNDGNGGVGCPCLPDQPLLGVDGSGIYISTNAYTLAALTGEADCSPDASGCFNGAQVYSISKVALAHGLQGGVGTHYDTYCSSPCFPGTGGNSQPFSLQPTLSSNGKSTGQNDGTEYVLGSTDWCAAPSVCPGDDQNAILVGGITMTSHLNAAPPNSGPFVLEYFNTSTTYEFPQLAVPQKPGPTPLADESYCTGCTEQGILSNDDRMNQTFYNVKDKTVWGALNSEVVGTDGNDHVGVAFWNAKATWTSSTSFTATFPHQGYVATKTSEDWFPSIVVTNDGKVTMGLDTSATAQFPSAAYVTFSPGSTSTIHKYGNGTAPEDGFTCYPQLFGYGPPCRWGDYTSAQTNGTTVWVGGEWIPDQSARPQNGCDGYSSSGPDCANWGTRWASLSA